MFGKDSFPSFQNDSIATIFDEEKKMAQNMFGIKRIVCCILHLQQRITEALIVNTLANRK